ncbi:MAG: lipopolysaccharide heptosyltransferase family protein [Xanthobacteraceae bacterium]|nr:MAG: lipopolysaccharide heptosyltransferase family protein [Xanthobacteraceae bacterium]
MKVLVVKHGALGDVVRTSYFAGPLRRKNGPDFRQVWITAPGAECLIRHNPYIDRIATGFDQIQDEFFDVVFSLDDEDEILSGLDMVRCGQVVGAMKQDGQVRYSQDASPWFDMGLHSRFGKARADELKKLNTQGHAGILSRIFGVDMVEPRFFGSPEIETEYSGFRNGACPVIGINPFAGGRWPAKELRLTELDLLIRKLLSLDAASRGYVVLFGAGPDRERNNALAHSIGDPRVIVADTDQSPLHLAALIRQLDFMISSDSLAMHLAISQRIPTVAFFSPTSAAEIDGFDRVEKVISLAPDYCSYRKDADNASITHGRLLDALNTLSNNSTMAPHASKLESPRVSAGK